jgi:hypothetical protein
MYKYIPFSTTTTTTTKRMYSGVHTYAFLSSRFREMYVLVHTFQIGGIYGK